MQLASGVAGKHNRWPTTFSSATRQRTSSSPTPPARFLNREGIRCWIAPRDILPGADWGRVDRRCPESRARLRARVLVPCERVATDQAGGGTRRQSWAGRYSATHRGCGAREVARIFHQHAALARCLQPPLERHLNYLADIIRHILDGEERPMRPSEPSKRSGRTRRSMLIGALALVLVGAALAAAWRFIAFPPPSAPAEARAPAAGISTGRG